MDRAPDNVVNLLHRLGWTGCDIDHKIEEIKICEKKRMIKL